MMNESEVISLIRKTVRYELAQTLLGGITNTDDQQTGSVRRFDTDSEIKNLRLIRPFGFASRPTTNTSTVTHPVNGDPSHILLLGEFDSNRPTIANAGDSAVYNATGKVIGLILREIHIGNLSASSPLVLGEVMQSFCDQLISILSDALTAIANGPVGITTSPGQPTPTEPALTSALESAVSDLTTLQTNLVDTAETNFLSQTCFTERGSS